LLKLDGAAVESVEVPNDDRVDKAVLDIGHEALVGRARFAAACRDVVVGVHANNVPASLCGYSAAVLLLAGHAKGGAVVGANPGVDRSTHHSHRLLGHLDNITLLNCLAAAIPPRERTVTCEEVFELQVHLPDVVALQTRQPNLEGEGEIRQRRLIKEALRMRPNRLIVGEIRQEECLDLLIALNSGFPGMTSLHANSAREALVKLTTLPLLASFILREVKSQAHEQRRCVVEDVLDALGRLA